MEIVKKCISQNNIFQRMIMLQYWVYWLILILMQIRHARHSYIFNIGTQRKKCPYSELFWFAFFPDFPAFRLNTLSVFSQNVGKCGKNVDQNNSECGHFLRSAKLYPFVLLSYRNSDVRWTFEHGGKTLIHDLRQINFIS